MPNDIAMELADKVGQTLPPVYLQFLDSLPERAAKAPEGVGALMLYTVTDRQWRPYPREELSEIKGDGKHIRNYAKALETAALADFYRSGSADDQEEWEAYWSDKGITLDSLARGFCIGDDGNGEPIFIDAETGAVYVHYHDGADISRWADSVEEFLNNSVDLFGS